jgi:membrane protease YdiL (CAAX protease family)
MAYEQTLPPAIAGLEPSPPQPDRAPWGYADIAMAIAVVIGGIIAVGLPAAGLAAAIAGGFGEVEDDPAAMAVLDVANLAGSLILALAVFLFTVNKYKVPWSALGLRRPQRGGFWFPLIVFFAALIVFYTYAIIITELGFDAEGNVDEAVRDSAVRIVLTGILAVAVAPFVEELFFRGFVFGGLLGRWGVAGAALGSGALFGLVHFQDPSSLAIIPGVALIGVIFASAYYYSGSLLPSFVAHLLWNITAFVVTMSGVVD